MSHTPVTAIIVGAGHRAMCYARYAKHASENLHIVGCADPNPVRRKMAADEFGLNDDQLFESAEALAARGKIADAVINGTMDDDHVRTSLPLLEAGYDILLEKPFAVTEEEMWQLVSAAQRLNRKVMICHVLRYAPFYTAIRELVAAGEIGRIMNIQTVEHVSYHHAGTCFVRGKWNRTDVCHSTTLLAKCCHDLDLVAWMKSGIAPVRVSALGGLMFFNAANAPEGAGTRCMVDCPIEAQCDYSARKMYIDHPRRWGPYVWAELEHLGEPTLEQKIASLKGDNPHGRCVWKCDNDMVDHQSVVIEFEDGATATHNLVCGTAKPVRTIHLLGTHGEIEGNLEESRFVIRHMDPRPGHETAERVVDLNVEGDMHGAFGGHGGGDLRLVADFVNVLRGEARSISCTSIDDSVHGHAIVFCADRAMAERRVIIVPEGPA